MLLFCPVYIVLSHLSTATLTELTFSFQKPCLEKEMKSIVFQSVQNIDLPHLAELQEASWIILKQKTGIWVVCLCDVVHRNSGRLFHWRNSWRKPNQIHRQKPVHIPKGTLCYENEKNPLLGEFFSNLVLHFHKVGGLTRHRFKKEWSKYDF